MPDRRGHHRHVALGRKARDQSLRPVAAGHPDDVGAQVERVDRQLSQVGSVLEHERLVAALAAHPPRDRRVPPSRCPYFGLMMSTP